MAAICSSARSLPTSQIWPASLGLALRHWRPCTKLDTSDFWPQPESSRHHHRNVTVQSWPAYEDYTGNFGTQTFTDILYTHLGPNPQSQDGNGYRQWTRADNGRISMDRTVSNGTGYAGQYSSQVATLYEDLNTMPDDLLFWFHHVSYDHVLCSGKTVAQNFYDAHYAGAETAHAFVDLWKSLEALIDDDRYQHVLFRQQFQADHSVV